MAIAAAVGDVYLVKIEGRIEGQQTVNVYYFECVGATADVELHLIQVLLTCFINNLLPVLSPSWTLERIIWQQVAPTLGVEQISVPQGLAQGGAAGDALPSFNAAVISKRTLVGGRSHRGRMYIAGVPENAAIGSTLNPNGEFWAAILAFCLCLVNNFVHPDPAGGSDIFQIEVFSRKLGGSVLPINKAGLTAIRELVPVAQLGTMRSRKVGKGS
jgi:hypothetical protein